MSVQLELSAPRLRLVELLLLEAAKSADILPVGTYKVYGVAPKPEHVYVKISIDKGAKNWVYYAGKNSPKGQEAMAKQAGVDEQAAVLKQALQISPALDLDAIAQDLSLVPDAVRDALGPEWKGKLAAALKSDGAVAQAKVLQAWGSSAVTGVSKPKAKAKAPAPETVPAPTAGPVVVSAPSVLAQPTAPAPTPDTSAQPDPDPPAETPPEAPAPSTTDTGLQPAAPATEPAVAATKQEVLSLALSKIQSYGGSLRDLQAHPIAAGELHNQAGSGWYKDAVEALMSQAGVSLAQLHAEKADPKKIKAVIDGVLATVGSESVQDLLDEPGAEDLISAYDPNATAEDFATYYAKLSAPPPHKPAEPQPVVAPAVVAPPPTDPWGLHTGAPAEEPPKPPINPSELKAVVLAKMAASPYSTVAGLATTSVGADLEKQFGKDWKATFDKTVFSDVGADLATLWNQPVDKETADKIAVALMPLQKAFATNYLSVLAHKPETQELLKELPSGTTLQAVDDLFQKAVMVAAGLAPPTAGAGSQPPDGSDSVQPEPDLTPEKKAALLGFISSKLALGAGHTPMASVMKSDGAVLTKLYGPKWQDTFEDALMVDVGSKLAALTAKTMGKDEAAGILKALKLVRSALSIPGSVSLATGLLGHPSAHKLLAGFSGGDLSAIDSLNKLAATVYTTSGSAPPPESAHTTPAVADSGAVTPSFPAGSKEAQLWGDAVFQKQGLPFIKKYLHANPSFSQPDYLAAALTKNIPTGSQLALHMKEIFGVQWRKKGAAVLGAIITQLKALGSSANVVLPSGTGVNQAAPTPPSPPAPTPTHKKKKSIGGLTDPALSDTGELTKPANQLVGEELLSTYLATLGVTGDKYTSVPSSSALAKAVAQELSPESLGTAEKLLGKDKVVQAQALLNLEFNAPMNFPTSAVGVENTLGPILAATGLDKEYSGTSTMDTMFKLLHAPSHKKAALNSLFGPLWPEKFKFEWQKHVLAEKPDVLAGAVLAAAGAKTPNATYLAKVIEAPYPKFLQKLYAATGIEGSAVIGAIKSAVSSGKSLQSLVSTPDAKMAYSTGGKNITDPLVTVEHHAPQYVPFLKSAAMKAAVASVPVAPVASTPASVPVSPPVVTPPAPKPVVVSNLPKPQKLKGKSKAAFMASLGDAQGIPHSGFALLPPEEQVSKEKVGGVYEKFLVRDADGHVYMAKPVLSGPNADPYRLHASAVVGRLQSLLHANGDYVPVQVRKVPGPDGKDVLASVQPMVNNLGDFSKLDLTKMTPNQKRAVVNERVLDWLVGNTDAKADNWLLAKDGTPMGIDKERAFKPFLSSTPSDQLNTTYSPTSVPVYNAFFEAYANGKIELNPNDALPAIEALQSLSSDEYKKVLQPYLDSLAEAPLSMSKDKVDSIFASADTRRKNLKKDFEGFFSTLLKRRGGTGSFAFPTVSPSELQAPSDNPVLSPLAALDTRKSVSTPAAGPVVVSAQPLIAAPVEPTLPPPGPSPQGLMPQNDTQPPGPGTQAKIFTGPEYMSKFGVATKPHKTDPTKVALKLSASSPHSLSTVLEALGLKADSIEKGSLNNIAIISKSDLEKAAVLKNVGIASTESSSSQYAPPNPAAKPTIVQYKKAKPNPHIIKDLDKVEFGTNGVAVFTDGGALEGQVMRFKKFVDAKGKEYFSLDSKLLFEAHSAALKAPGGTQSTAIIPGATWDPAKKAFVTKPGPAFTFGAKVWSDEDSEIALSTDHSNAAWAGGMVAKIYPKVGETPEDAFRRIVSKVSPALAETLLKPPTEDDLETKKLHRALWAMMPQTHDVFRTLSPLTRTNELARALLRGDQKAFDTLMEVAPSKRGRLTHEQQTGTITDAEFDQIQDTQVMAGYVAPTLPGRWKKLAKGKVQFLMEGVSSLSGLLGLLGANNPGGEGGNLIGVNERILSGIEFGGSGSGSADEDLRSGSADGLNFHVMTAAGGHKDFNDFSFCEDTYVAVVAPDELDRLDTYMHLTDTYGSTGIGTYNYTCTKRFDNRVSVSDAIELCDRHIAGEHPHIPSGLDSISYGTNEINFRKGVNKGKVVRVSCHSTGSRDSAISACKSRGLHEINGIAVEDFFVLERTGTAIHEKYLKPLGY